MMFREFYQRRVVHKLLFVGCSLCDQFDEWDAIKLRGRVNVPGSLPKKIWCIPTFPNHGVVNLLFPVLDYAFGFTWNLSAFSDV